MDGINGENTRTKLLLAVHRIYTPHAYSPGCGFDGNVPGKTLILYSWLLGFDSIIATHPTPEFNVEKIVTDDGYVFMVWDISGCERFRPKRRHFFEGTQAIVFVVDSTHEPQIESAKSDLHDLLQEQDLKTCPLLVIANKQDLPDAMPLSTVQELLKLTSITERAWSLCGIQATKQEGINKALSELCRLLS